MEKLSLWAAMLAMHGTLGGGCATWLNPAADASWRRGRRRSQAAFSVRHLLVPCLLALGEAVAGARWQTRGSHDRKPPTAEAAHSITDAHFRGSGDGISGRAPETEETAPTLGWEFVEGVKNVCTDMHAAAHDGNVAAWRKCMHDTDRVVSIITSRISGFCAPRFSNAAVQRAHGRVSLPSSSSSLPSGSLCKCARSARQHVRELFAELIMLLLNEHVQLLDDSITLLKASNLLMIKILASVSVLRSDIADPTLSFGVCISLLRPLRCQVAPEYVASAEYIAFWASLDFTDLVCRCIIKLTKVRQRGAAPRSSAQLPLPHSRAPSQPSRGYCAFQRLNAQSNVLKDRAANGVPARADVA
eukprot:jgi/Mesen1/439/ME000101S10667